MRYFIYLSLILFFTSCNEIVKGVAEEISDSMDVKDSLSELGNDSENIFSSYLSEDYKIIERKKLGEDSLFLVERFYNSGSKYADMRYKNNLRDGVSSFFHRNGTSFFKIIFKDNKEYTVIEAFDNQGKPLNCGNLKNGTGKLIFYDAVNDSKFTETNFVNCKKEGEVSEYYSTGELFKKGNFVNDKLQGIFIKYYKNGKIKEKGNFFEGIVEGNFANYFRSGAINHLEIWKNKKKQYSVEYDIKGFKIKEQTFISAYGSLFETTYIYGNDGHLTSKGEFKNGLKNGAYSYYNEVGKAKSTEIWRNDTLLIETNWYETGNLKSKSIYKNNELDSIYTEYYSDGKLRLQQQYKNGKKNGKYFSFYANGKKYVIGNYTDNEPLGKFQYYTKEGVYKGENEFKVPKK